MQNQQTKNCHFVSKCVTKPWEAKDHFLCFYDFIRNRFMRRSSQSLLAAANLNSNEVELWLKNSFEDKARTLVAELQAAALEVVPRSEARYRPLWLLLALQGARTTSVVSDVAREHLARWAIAKPQEFDAVLRPLQESVDLRILRIAGEDLVDETICVPSQGGFGIAVRDPACVSGRSFAFALPLDQRSALVATPVGARGHVDVVELRKTVAASSVGIQNSTRVVVPPAVLELHRVALRERLLRDRERNERETSVVNEQRGLALLTFKAMGLDMELDAIGRIRVPRLPDGLATDAACEVEILPPGRR